MINYNTQIVVVRRTDDGEHRINMNAVVSSKHLLLPVDADVEEGDQVERRLPNGKVQNLRITKVDVLQSPFGSSELDHTEATYTTASAETPSRRGGDTFHVHATNVQVSTGDRSQQTMTVGQTADQLVLVIQGITEMLRSLGVVTNEQESRLEQVQQDAIADVSSDKPSSGGVLRFYNWVLDCVKQGGTAATVAVTTAALNGLLTDAEALARAMGN